MRRILVLAVFGLTTIFNSAFAQSSHSIKGKVTDNSGKGIQSVTVSLLKAADSSLVKADVTDENGAFEIVIAPAGKYLLNYTMIGFERIYSAPFEVKNGQGYDAGSTTLQAAANKLTDVTVTSRKPMIEIKADKTVFNVENSINATGSNALELLQKSPGIQVDNNENISMKGKTGVRIYVDGKMTQLGSQDLAAYLKSINSNDVEAIEMISNPSARYDASGNAGIINIRLKKNKKFGTNGSVNLGFIQGVTPKGNGSVSLNYRDKKVNLFSNIGGNLGRQENTLDLYRVQRDTIYDQKSTNWSDNKSLNAKVGADLFLNSKSTLGFLVTTNIANTDWSSESNTNITYKPTNQYVKKLVALNTIPGSRTNMNSNINYRYTDSTGKEINFDADYGLFRGTGRSFQPNNYLDNSGNMLSRVVNRNYTPTDIDIYTAKVDVDQPKWKGKLGYGAKFSYVKTTNTFDFFNDINGTPVKILSRSNSFTYKENVNAAYVNYQRQLNPKWSLQTGLRMEQTNSEGVLTRADGVVQADNTVKRNYLDFFPSAALTWAVNQKHTLNLTFSRRIDRPTYQDLNPFENKLDELTYEKGNAFLRPQYTNTVELSHTFKYMLNTTIGYSHVKDFATQTTDTTNNATFVQQKNLATQRILSFSIGSPLPIAKWWNGYANIWYNYQMFKGKIGENEVKTDIPMFGAYMQHSFTLGGGYTAEMSGWFSGPSVWGATWKTRSLGGLDLGFQKQVLKKQGTVKLSVTDIFFTNPWTATSNFGGLYINGSGRNESRTVRLAFSWRFGNSQVKAARQRQTGLETEAKRIKG
ncbi:TonB-dependent receptor domain-containing protein [Sediminibacterium goheungense]|uniref:Outer membrane receptor protein involved in Fe transport n=1 Tax=Sediminibacterium goheungense TaxID=1086393 RepID=A0A4R6J083_9BACT|nr:TonB-dependent receptor [Sediminibacterium goheungense]TDO28592.1 outer membrane receptor protein involved in Fe transport [Sediminibacterium goheungense]